MPVAAGERIYASDIPIEEIPLGRMVQAVAQSIPDAVITPLTWTTEDFDTHNFHDPVTNNSRVTPNIAGYYEIWGEYYSAAPVTPANLDAFIRKNGAGSIPSGNRGNDGALAQSRGFHCMMTFNGTTDYFEICAFQDSAGATNTNVSARFTSYVEWKYLRPL